MPNAQPTPVVHKIENKEDRWMLLKSLIWYFRSNPNSSPRELIEADNFPPGEVDAAIAALVSTGHLVVTGHDEHGVLLSRP